MMMCFALQPRGSSAAGRRRRRLSVANDNAFDCESMCAPRRLCVIARVCADGARDRRPSALTPHALPGESVATRRRRHSRMSPLARLDESAEQRAGGGLSRGSRLVVREGTAAVIMSAVQCADVALLAFANAFELVITRTVACD
jgi:hypothetical protein